MGKHFTDHERFNWVKRYRASGEPLAKFARNNGLGRETLRWWNEAYSNLEGNFIRVDKIPPSGSAVIDTNDVTMNLLSPEQILSKSKNFTRFDHSIVVIEFGKTKVTTSLEQALTILGRYYDRL